MDGSPQLTDVSFAIAKRGYDPEEVDNYLERVNAAVVQLRAKLREAVDRADAAEARANEAAAHDAGTEMEETLKRTLVLAQRTADQAIADAQAQARTLVEEATANVTSVLADADAAAASLRAEAAEEAAKAREQARREADKVLREARAQADRTIGELEQRRALLLTDLDVLQQHLDTERARLHASLGQLQRLIELPESFRVGAAPDLQAPASTTVSAPAPAVAPMLDGPTDDELRMIEAELDRDDTGTGELAIVVGLDGTAPADTAPLPSRGTHPTAAPDVEPVAVAQAAALADAASVPPAPEPLDEPMPASAEAEVAVAATPAAADADEAAEAAASPAAAALEASPVAVDDDLSDPNMPRQVAPVLHLHERRAAQAAADGGPPTMAVEMVFDDEDDEDDDDLSAEMVVPADDTDTFLANLRRAVNDDAAGVLPGDAEQDAAMRAFFDQDLDAPKPRRFGRKH